MKVLIGRILVLFFLMTALWVGVKDKGIFKLQEIHFNVAVKEADRVAWGELNSLIEKELLTLKGQPMWRVSLVRVRQQLQRHSLLKNIEVQKSWPHTLEINYSLPELRAVYQDRRGDFRILVDGGQWINPVKWSNLPGLPWLRGDWIEKDLKTKESVLNLLGQIPQQGPLAANQISEIQFTELDGFLLTLIKSGQQILFGNDNFEIKSLRVTQVLEYLQSRGLESRVIDANFSKKVLVRLRNHP
jgi:cell division protein FtsQ